MELLTGLGRDEILEILSQELCEQCLVRLDNRAHTLLNKTGRRSDILLSKNNGNESSTKLPSDAASDPSLSENIIPPIPIPTPESVHPARRKGYASNFPLPSVKGKQLSFTHRDSEILFHDGLHGGPSIVDNGVLEDDEERIRFSALGRKKDFVHIERIHGKQTNILQGLELHTKVFNAEEQKKIVEVVYNLQRMGQKGDLCDRTYSEPRKWMRGKGRVTMQFGCCYNYAVDKNGNPPGIVREEDVDPLPPMFKRMIKRMVRWHILPPTCIPNSCIVNLYDEGDCIPPHIDHHDFLRPFCTVSFLTECNILFGSNLKIVSPGEFAGPVSIPLPVGSVLILNGNGADIAKHCVPAVPTKRISITFRKMDDSKLPYRYAPDPELMGVKPMVYSSLNKSPIQETEQRTPLYTPNNKLSSQDIRYQNGKLAMDDPPFNKSAPQPNRYQNGKGVMGDPLNKSAPQQNRYQTGKLAMNESEIETFRRKTGNLFVIEKNDFPPLGGCSNSGGNRPWVGKAGSKQ